MKLSVVVEKDDAGYFAYCPELKGCHSQGDTYDEAVANVTEAVELYLETMSEDEKKEALSKEILTTSIEVAVA